MTETPLRLFNSLTRQLEDFKPLTGNEARVYTCGPTVYNYQHIGNMRAYIFADTLGRALRFKGYDLKHVINITDVGHLTSDADAGDDKMEKAATAQGKTAWDIAKFYTDAYWRDIDRLNIRQPFKWSIATDYVPAMIEFAQGIADTHCYLLDSGLYFDISTVPDYGRLARDDVFLSTLSDVNAALHFDSQTSPDQATTNMRVAVERLTSALRRQIAKKALDKYVKMLAIWEGVEHLGGHDLLAALPKTLKATRSLLHERRIERVEGKRNDEDFAIWRTTPLSETRQMEWDSPWGKGAPGWHLECSVMSEALLGLPFDIHTGGIDHREIHHPNEIAQNQAHCGGADTGARIWMHNNFLIDRVGKMSKSTGDFLTLQALIDRGFHPLAYRLMCLQAHYRSEMEFTWEGLAAAQTRLKRMVMGVERLRARAAQETPGQADMTLRQVDERILKDLNTAGVLEIADSISAMPEFASDRLDAIHYCDELLGLNLLTLTRADLRIRPASATLTEADIEARLDERKVARAAKDFATSDRIRDDLIAAGVEVMDGDPLGWDWKLDI